MHSINETVVVRALSQSAFIGVINWDCINVSHACTWQNPFCNLITWALNDWLAKWLSNGFQSPVNASWPHYKRFVECMFFVACGVFSLWNDKDIKSSGNVIKFTWAELDGFKWSSFFSRRVEQRLWYKMPAVIWSLVTYEWATNYVIPHTPSVRTAHKISINFLSFEALIHMVVLLNGRQNNLIFSASWQFIRLYSRKFISHHSHIL